MQIKRSSSPSMQAAPYTIMFEVEQCINFSETSVASKALSLRPYTAELLKLPRQEVFEWAHLAARIGASEARGNRYLQSSLDELRRLGTGLLHFADSTEDALSMMQSSNPPADQSFAIRMLEGDIARNMVQTIEQRRVKIPKLWQPDSARRRPIGFRAQAH